MAKSPAWSIYAKEWLSSEAVALMPPEAEGLFIRLLNLSWDNGGLPSDPEAVKDLAGRKYARVWKTAWPPVRQKFVERGGRLVNPRQEEERAKQEERRAQRTKAATERWEKERQKDAHAYAHADQPYMRDVCEPVSSPQSIAFAVASAGTTTTSVRTVPADAATNQPPVGNRMSYPAETIRRLCYPPDGQPPDGHDISRDLQWWNVKVVKGEPAERIVMALEGAPQVMTSLAGVKWSPAKVFTKGGDWASLYERAVTARGRNLGRKRAPTLIGQVLNDAQRKAAP